MLFRPFEGRQIIQLSLGGNSICYAKEYNRTALEWEMMQRFCQSANSEGIFEVIIRLDYQYAVYEAVAQSSDHESESV